MGARASWSGQLAFVLAAAASAIGLGNLWRFPYLAARYGGGTFIVVYLALVVDPFYSAMAVTIMCGLGFSTLVTMVVVPVNYALIHRVRRCA